MVSLSDSTWWAEVRASSLISVKERSLSLSCFRNSSIWACKLSMFGLRDELLLFRDPILGDGGITSSSLRTCCRDEFNHCFNQTYAQSFIQFLHLLAGPSQIMKGWNDWSDSMLWRSGKALHFDGVKKWMDSDMNKLKESTRNGRKPRNLIE